MNIEIWLMYLGAVFAFMCTPGPSHILMLSNSLGNGFKKSTATAMGDLSANFLQMLAASAGLASILRASQEYFVVVKWAGVIYLAYLGIKLCCSRYSNIESASSRSTSSLYWQGFIKAVIFFAALFPQFISASEPLVFQFAVLSATYLVIDGLFLCFYGKFADFFANKSRSHIGKYLNKISGTLFISAAILLGLKDVEKR